MLVRERQPCSSHAAALVKTLHLDQASCRISPAWSRVDAGSPFPPMQATSLPLAWYCAGQAGFGNQSMGFADCAYTAERQ